ncbi:hypothetical protein P8825_14850 [Shouchella clausii]|uniref:hypothetical protein n=1 Tax=Shouchella clausii TaxID=79880 RepID=UPI002DB828ED|nr:hypothetical protein [Shouchella clausii]MEB5480842.1 hypothetical protein [Shouchella clausii]
MTIINKCNKLISVFIISILLCGCSVQAYSDDLHILDNSGHTVLSLSDGSANVFPATVHSAELDGGKKDDVLIVNMFDVNEQVVINNSNYGFNYGETVLVYYDIDIPDSLQAQNVIKIEKASSGQVERLDEIKEEMPTNEIVYTVSHVNDNGLVYALSKHLGEIILSKDCFPNSPSVGQSITVEFYNTGTFDDIKSVTML